MLDSAKGDHLDLSSIHEYVLLGLFSRRPVSKQRSQLRFMVKLT